MVKIEDKRRLLFINPWPMLRGSFEVIFGGMNGIGKLKYSISSNKIVKFSLSISISINLYLSLRERAATIIILQPAPENFQGLNSRLFLKCDQVIQSVWFSHSVKHFSQTLDLGFKSVWQLSSYLYLSISKSFFITER